MRTELAAICARMKPAIRQQWLARTFPMLLQDRALYLNAQEEIAQEGRFDTVQTDAGTTEKVFIMTSDNPHVSRATSSQAAVKIIRSTTGRTAIMCDRNCGIDLINLATMIRMEEYRIATGKRMSLEDAKGFGTNSKAENWCLPNANLLLNSSFSHPWVKPSRLSLDKIVTIVKDAFMATSRKKWLLWYEEGSEAKAAGFFARGSARLVI